MTTTEQEILLSIIIPAYNVEEYIETTIESICKNKLDRLEIVVINDGCQFLKQKQNKNRQKNDRIVKFYLI